VKDALIFVLALVLCSACMTHPDRFSIVPPTGESCQVSAQRKALMPIPVGARVMYRHSSKKDVALEILQGSLTKDLWFTDPPVTSARNHVVVMDQRDVVLILANGDTAKVYRVRNHKGYDDLLVWHTRPTEGCGPSQHANVYVYDILESPDGYTSEFRKRHTIDLSGPLACADGVERPCGCGRWSATSLAVETTSDETHLVVTRQNHTRWTTLKKVDATFTYRLRW